MDFPLQESSPVVGCISGASPVFPIASPPSQSPSPVPFSSIPLHQPSPSRAPSPAKSFAEALCSGPSFAHPLLHKSNAFCHPLPVSFEGFSDDCPDNCDTVKIKKATVYEGRPCIYLTNEELDLLDKPLELTLIAKFSMGRPKWVSLLQYFNELNLSCGFRINNLDARHVVIHFFSLNDYSRVFAKPVTIIKGFTVKFLKWTRHFDVHMEPSITPVWITFPGMCFNLYTRSMLFSIGKIFGRPLLLDSVSAKGNRPAFSRLLVEVDVLKDHPGSVWIGNDESGYAQEVVLENKPMYCDHCCKYGHMVEMCYFKNPHLRAKKNPTIVEENQREIVVDVNPLGNMQNGSDLGGGGESNGNPPQSICVNMQGEGKSCDDEMKKGTEDVEDGKDVNGNCDLQVEDSLLRETQLVVMEQPAAGTPRGEDINVFNWDEQVFEDQADRIIELAATQLIEECYHIVFEGASEEHGKKSVKNNLMQQGVETSRRMDGNEWVAQNLSTMLAQADEECLNVQVGNDKNQVISSGNADDMNWMGMKLIYCNDDEGIRYSDGEEGDLPPKANCRRLSWSEEVEKDIVLKQHQKKYKKKMKPQIQVDLGSTRKTRSCNKEDFFQLP